MDHSRLGRIARALRIKKRLRQADLAARARVARSAVSRLERGRAGELRLDAIVRIVEAPGGRLAFQVQWQGGDLDRLLNARHSALHESVARFFLDLPGWILGPEVSLPFAASGE